MNADHGRLTAVRLGAGDESVLNELLRASRPALRCYLLRRSRRLANDIDDILVLALHRLWRHRDRFDASKGTVRAWFWRIAVNAARDRLRRLRSRHETSVDPARLNALTAEANAIAPRRPPRLPASLTIHLEKIPENERRVLLEDAASPEGTAPNSLLAEQLGVAPSTVRAYRARARKRLRRLLARSGRTY